VVSLLWIRILDTLNYKFCVGRQPSAAAGSAAKAANRVHDWSGQKRVTIADIVQQFSDAGQLKGISICYVYDKN
jgi:hypothetical protein